ncbi:hypothetical protein BST61_g7972 [Cercospora zeina]
MAHQERPTNQPTLLASGDPSPPLPPAAHTKKRQEQEGLESRGWTWTTEMERDLLLAAAWGEGNDMEDRYPGLVEDFAEDYGIIIEERELRERFAELRDLQVVLLTRWGFQPPQGAPPPSSAPPDDELQTEEMGGEEESAGDAAFRQNDGGQQDVVDDGAGTAETPLVGDSEQSDQSVAVPTELFLSAARELAAQNESDDR